MSQIIINNKGYVGKSITITNGNVIIDGKSIEIEEKEINISVTGDINDLRVTSCNSLEIKGNVKTIETTSGDINIEGDVSGNVKTVSGDVRCGNITGDVKTVSGDIKRR